MISLYSPPWVTLKFPVNKSMGLIYLNTYEIVRIQAKTRVLIQYCHTLAQAQAQAQAQTKSHKHKVIAEAKIKDDIKTRYFIVIKVKPRLRPNPKPKQT